MLRKRFSVLVFSIATSGALLAQSENSETISLQELIPLALKRDFQIRAVELDTEMAAQNARAAAGYWDPAVRAQYSEGALGTGGGAVSAFSTTAGDILEAGVEANLTTGGRLSITGAQARFENFGRDDYGAAVGATLSQPLLQNFGAAVAKSRIRVAKRNYEQSEWLFRQEVISTITRAITLYNQVALAKDSLRVAEQSRELAAQLVKDTRTRANLGSVEARGVEVAETRLAQRETLVVLQRRIFLDALNELKRLITTEALALLSWNIELADLPAPKPWDGDLLQDYEYALDHRPDYQQALIEIEKAELEVNAERSLALPQLDLAVSYSLTAFADSYDSSLKALDDAEDDLLVSVVFRRPILNRTAKANLAAARLFKDKAFVVQQQLQQAIAIQLDNAARRIRAEEVSRELTRQGREFAERSLEAEERKLKLGQSTTFFVLELQEDLAEAQVRELEAIANYNIAVARYEQVKGITLDANGVEL